MTGTLPALDGGKDDEAISQDVNGGRRTHGGCRAQRRAPSNAPLNVGVTLKYDGRPHAVWRLPFTNVSPGAANLVKGEWKPAPGMDEAMVSLSKDGKFTYRLQLNFPDNPQTPEDDPFTCDARYAGHSTN
jgi:hypothetical protein